MISGDVKSEEAITLSEKYFGPINRGEEVRKLRIPRVNLPQNKYKKFADRIYFPLAAFVFPTVSNYHKDDTKLLPLIFSHC